jgi:hypothetical protein
VKTRLGSSSASHAADLCGSAPESVCAMSAVKVRRLGIVLPIIFVAGFVRLS